MDFVVNRYYIDYRYGKVLIFVDYNIAFNTYNFIDVDSGRSYIIDTDEIEFIKNF